MTDSTVAVWAYGLAASGVDSCGYRRAGSSPSRDFTGPSGCRPTLRGNRPQGRLAWPWRSRRGPPSRPRCQPSCRCRRLPGQCRDPGALTGEFAPDAVGQRPGRGLGRPVAMASAAVLRCSTSPMATRTSWRPSRIAKTDASVRSRARRVFWTSPCSNSRWALSTPATVTTAAAASPASRGRLLGAARRHRARSEGIRAVVAALQRGQARAVLLAPFRQASREPLHGHSTPSPSVMGVWSGGMSVSSVPARRTACSRAASAGSARTGNRRFSAHGMCHTPAGQVCSSAPSAVSGCSGVRARVRSRWQKAS